MAFTLRSTIACLAPIAATLAACAANNALGAGFALSESSAAAVANAFSGGAAGAADASTVFFNPAGMSALPGNQAMFVLSAIAVSSQFSNSGSRSPIGSPATGNDGGDAGTTPLVPAAFLSYRLSAGDRLTLGLGLNVPFGLQIDYDSGWKGRYQALKSDLQSMNIQPAIAWQLSPAVSLGAGISIMRVKAELTRAIDFGAACFANVGPALCTAAGVLPGSKDGIAKVEGSDWGYGANLGAMFNLGSDARIGVTYRSKVRQEVSGSATFANPSLPGPFAALTQTNATTNTDARATVDLPESVAIGFFAPLGGGLTLMGEAAWTRWSRIQELRVKFANGAPDSVVPLNWKNVTRIALGLNYQWNEDLKLRAGLAWDPSPVEDDNRTARIPDNDRTILGIGVSYAFAGGKDTVDFGYNHLFVKGGSINHTEAGAGTLLGNYETHADIVSLQFSHAF